MSTIDKIYPFLDDWCKYFGSNEILEDLLLTLILSCSNGGTKIINLLLECALGEHVVYNIREKSMEILRKFLLHSYFTVGNPYLPPLLKIQPYFII